jgi:hypothetical protein
VEQSEKHRAKLDYSAAIDTCVVEQEFLQQKERKEERKRNEKNVGTIFQVQKGEVKRVTFLTAVTTKASV